MSAQPSPDAADAPPPFPLFLDLRDRVVLVLGGDSVARRKVDALLAAGAKVTLCAQEPDGELRARIDAGLVRHQRGPFDPAWLEAVWLVVIATRDRDVNRLVADAAHRRRIFVNVVDDAALSSCHVPARVHRGPLQIAISTGGAAPVVARRLRERLEAELDESLGTLPHLLKRERGRIRDRFPDPRERRRFFERLLAGEVPRLLRAGDAAAAEATLKRALDEGTPMPQAGSVALVGAGPGDPGLLTLKGLRALQEADVILHDRLVGSAILDLARRDAERIDVGKRVGEDHAATQGRIHALMLRHARAGHRVIRLQGGDPLVFGRAGEELDFLRAHAIPHEVIPGITAALACAAAAGVSLTDRRCAQSVALVAAHTRTTRDVPAARAWSAPGQTVVFYMAVGELESLSHTLIRHGRAADTACVLVENGSLPSQRVLAGTLAELPALARAHKLNAPAVLILGETAARARCMIRAECGAANANVPRIELPCGSGQASQNGARHLTPAL